MSQIDTSHFDQAAANWDDNAARVRLMRTVGEAIVREARPTAAMQVLDYGCGTGLVGLYLLPHVASVTGADNSPGMIEVLRQKIEAGGLQNMRTLHLDLERDPVPGERFDLITVGMALHHIAEVERTLRAFYQMLRPGGLLCIADLDTEPGTFHYSHAKASVRHNGFDRGELKGRLEQIGFAAARDVTVIRFNRPVEPSGEAEFSIFLISARRA